jgi:hypothetical protein
MPITFILSFIVFFSSCQKNLRTPNKGQQDENLNVPLATVPSTCGVLIDSMPPINFVSDSVEIPTILGVQHTNPYLVPNMQQAHANLGITNVNVAVTNLYVRFLPSSPAQLGVLDSTLDVQGIDLFDVPMDYDITQEGDYYQDPSIPMEQVTYNTLLFQLASRFRQA